jgi:hypothetical protein
MNWYPTIFYEVIRKTLIFMNEILAVIPFHYCFHCTIDSSSSLLLRTLKGGSLIGIWEYESLRTSFRYYLRTGLPKVNKLRCESAGHYV